MSALSNSAQWLCVVALAACSAQRAPRAVTAAPVTPAATPAHSAESSSGDSPAAPDVESPAGDGSARTLATGEGEVEPEVAAEPPADPIPQLTDEAGKPLPQTDARPTADSPFVQWGVAALFDAIVHDDVERAMPFFFPLAAYEQVKDIARPGRDWETRLVRLFKRDIHEYHKRLGRFRGDAKLLRVEIPEDRARWMKPGSEGNRVGYFRVLRSVMVFEDHDGRERQLGITSLISWRGEWYVVHLNGFK